MAVSRQDHYDALETLQHVLGLPMLPRRIECFDISTIQGSETVASMVVCEDGRMKHSEYRKFRIRGQGSGIRGQGKPLIRNFLYSLCFIRPSSHTTIDATVSLP